MGEKKRVFKIKVVNFLLKHGAELLEVRTGEVEDEPTACTFLFANNDKLSKAFVALKAHTESRRLMLK
ncbi:hypothetical protein OA45_00073 [Bacillus sp. UMTAT18]|uniref:hypothetical protein n=1 Tax=Bacillus TaxID=1386 RepID=UPI0006186D83|nr:MULTISPECIES: hypothetical protein [unclassified Bacillus (in: firmicutes)]KKC56437.1 hypothetical protein OA45_00073 [Bacillus sp. UMTAT18]OJD77541.1 hypothetical protein BAU29_18650 [Bacillus sp. P14-1]